MADKNVNILITASDKTRTAFASAQNALRGMADGVERLRTRLSSSFVDVASIATSLGGGLSVKGIADMADEFASLQARLKLASRDMTEFTAANADLVRISAASAAPLAETATLYTRIASSVKDLNVSQSAIAGTTEAVALALRISGASSAEASSAMLQFSQAIASGVLRGEEFNAVNEAAPRLLQALARSLDVPVGSLRDMAKEGRLTRDVLINGLLAELPTLQREASSLPKTIGTAFTDLRNNLLLTVGEFDKATGASSALAEAVSKIGTTGIEALVVTGANVAFVFKGIGRDIGGIAAALSRIAVGDFSGARDIFRLMGEDARKARQELDEFEKRIFGIGRKAAAAAGGAQSPIAAVAADTDKFGAGLQAALRKAFSVNPIDDFLDSFNDRRKKIKAEYAALRDEISGGDGRQATSLDVRTALTQGRVALAAADDEAVRAAVAKAKDLFKDLAAQETTAGFEESYYLRELERLEMDAVSAAESTAAKVRDTIAEQMAALDENATTLAVQVDETGLVQQLKQAFDQFKKELADNPLRVPIVAVPEINSYGVTGGNLSTAALQYGARR